MLIKNKLIFCIISAFLFVLFFHQPVWGQARYLSDSELPAVRIAMSDDQSIIIERMLHEALRRAGYQMVTQKTGMRTAVSDVNYGDVVILPVQTDGWDKMYPNLIKVPVALDYVEFTAYIRSNDNYQFSEWHDIAGLKLGYRWQNEYIVNNLSRARAGALISLNTIDDLWVSLLDGKTDVIILPGMPHFEHRYLQGIKKAGVIERQPVFTYVNNKHAYLVPLLEKAYGDMINDGTMEMIHNGSINYNLLNENKPVILHINSFNAQNELERSQMESIRGSIEAELYNKPDNSKLDFQKNRNTPFEYYNLYLNSNEYHRRESFYTVVSDMVRTGFLMRHPDLIIASGDEAFEYVLNNYYLLFPGIPVLFTNVIKVQDSAIYGLENYVTGITQTISFNETVMRMLMLFPETKKIYILNDYYLNKSKKLMEDIKNNIKSVKQNLNKQNEYRPSVEFIFNENKPFAEIIDDIYNFESDTLVLIGKYFSDSDSVFYSEEKVQSMVSNASKNPVFCLISSYVGNGTLGGLIPDPKLQSDKTASMAVEILRGASPSQIPIIYDSSFLNRWQFDYHVIKKFNIKVRDLPKDRFIINRPIPLWESNPNQFRSILAAAALSLFMISGLVFFLRLMTRKEADDNMHILLDALPMCCQLWNRNLKTIDSNRAAIELFGCKTRYEYLDMFIENCSPEYQPDGQHSEKKAAMLVNKAFEEGYCCFEWMHRHISGDLIPAEVTLIRVKHNKEGHLVACYIRDLREYKTRIREIEKIHDDLRKACDAADSANKSKSTFLTNMSHEIRTPMNSIIGFAELAQLSNNQDKMKEYLSNILQSSKWLLKIINDILDISKIESGKAAMEHNPYDPRNEQIQSNVSLFDREKPNFSGDVLVCEDNNMNQQVIYEHLTRVGLRTIIAHNGKEGVDHVVKRIKNGIKPFDLILMDIHMPEMDGLEAASKITALGVKSPIIALTANIMPDDIETYKRNGMSDCIGKPFTSDELWRHLIKYLPVLFYSTENKNQNDSGITDLNDDEKFQKQIQTNFVRNNQNTYDNIINAVQNNDFKLAHRIVHTLKSNAGQIGKTKLQGAAAVLEGILAQGINPLKNEEIIILERELKIVLTELSPLLDEINAARVIKTNDVQKIRGIITKLEPMLVNKNPECEELLGDINTIPGAEELARLIDSFNFKQAIEELSKLKKAWE